MAISIVATSYGTPTTSPQINSSGADLMVYPVYLCVGPAANTSDNKSNTITELTQQDETPTGYGTVIGYTEAPTVGSGHDATNSQAFARQAIIAVAGAHATSYETQSGLRTTSGVTSIQPGPVTPSVDGCLIVVTLVAVGSGTITPPAGFTVVHNETNTAACAYMIQATAATIDPLWSWTNSVGAATALAVFKPAAGGGGGGTSDSRRRRFSRLFRFLQNL